MTNNDAYIRRINKYTTEQIKYIKYNYMLIDTFNMKDYPDVSLSIIFMNTRGCGIHVSDDCIAVKEGDIIYVYQ